MKPKTFEAFSENDKTFGCKIGKAVGDDVEHTSSRFLLDMEINRKHSQTLVAVEEKGVNESMLLETLAMRNMSNSRRSSS